MVKNTKTGDDTTKLILESKLASQSRREFTIGAMGGVAALFLGACVGGPDGSGQEGLSPTGTDPSMDPSASSPTAPGTSAPSTDAPADAITTDATGTCIVRPKQTEGPYFVDEKLQRVDVRSDPKTGVVSAGAILRVSFNVSRMSGTTCTPLAGANVDLWQCDAAGVYSDVVDGAGRFNTVGQKFLRGYQVTDKNGVAQFLTVYPGWYSGRTVHIHFKIRTTVSGRSYTFTSQLYFDDTFTDGVYKLPPYNTRGARSTRNSADGIYRSGGSQLLLAVTKDAQGEYAGSFNIALQV